jgi:flagellar biosynthesis GTPase FlhF
MSDQPENVSDVKEQAPVEPAPGKEPTPVQSAQPKSSESDSVRYETYRRVLSEKKREAERRAEVEARLEELEAAERNRKEAELKEQNKYQELLQLREKELAEERQKAKDLEERQINAVKLNKVLDAIPGNVPSKYWVHVDVSKVLVNPNTNEIDPASVQHVVKDFMEEHHQLIERPVSQAKIDPAAPEPNGAGRISADQWNKMSKEERKKSVGQVDGMADWMATPPAQVSR